MMAIRCVADQPVAVPDRPIAREISGHLAIGGEVGNEDSAFELIGRWVRFQISPNSQHRRKVFQPKMSFVNLNFMTPFQLQNTAIIVLSDF